MSRFVVAVLVAGIVLTSLLVAEAAVYEGKVVTKDKWTFWTKFCCSNEVPDYTCNMTYKLDSKSAGLEFGIYLGYAAENASTRNGEWDVVYAHRPGTRDAWSCEKLRAETRGGQNGLRPLGNGTGLTGVLGMTQRQRAYFWFAALMDCSSSHGVNVPSYHVTWTNPGGWWLRNFSFDQQGLVFVYLFYTFFYLGLALVHGYAVYRQYQEDQWHPVIRILTVAIVLGFLSNICETLHYVVYAGNGVGIPFILGAGDLLQMASQITLMFQCILLAKGWAITTSYLTDKYIVLVVMALFVIAYLALFIWDKAVPNPASVLYFYESIPGIIVAVLRVLTCGWFVWSLRNTIRLESLPEKRIFYFVFGGAYTIWFLLLPLIVLIAVFLAPWVRFRIVTSMMATADFLGFSALAFLMWPSRAANYFVIKSSPQLLAVKGSSYGSTSSAYDATNAL